MQCVRSYYSYDLYINCNCLLSKWEGTYWQTYRVDVKALDTIFTSMLRTMDQSKNDIFIISEQSRKSFDEMKGELETVKYDIPV